MVETARLLLEHGADPKRRNSEGLTAGDYARAQGHAAIAGLLS